MQTIDSIMTVFHSEGNLNGNVLVAENELVLFAKTVDAKLQFEKNQQGEITCLYILQHGDKIRAEKKK